MRWREAMGSVGGAGSRVIASLSAVQSLCHPEARKNEGVILGAWMTLSRGATFALRVQKERRWIAFSATRWQRNRGSAAHLFPSSSEKPIHPRILIFNLLHKTSLAAERGSMGGVEGPPRWRCTGQAEAGAFWASKLPAGFRAEPTAQAGRASESLE